uniref:Uncharacterized protein n=1 Tax=Lactuca sativa TaxID=4236 RepID=A0A9R1VDE4_LACSA|nr:hypothetical protein LSAT_V11C500228940 [Lactuca sativa]
MVISHALRANPVIHKDLITEIWKNASIKKHGADGVGIIESIVKGTQVIVSEQGIREVLEVGDAFAFPIEYSADQLKEVLEKMCYEAIYPPTIKKLLPPYWRFLEHYFVSCIFGRKGGYDEISQTATSSIVASSYTLDMKALVPNTFGLMKKSRKAAKVAYQGLKELFAEVENTDAASSINVEIVEEHVAPQQKFQFKFEEVEISDDEKEEVQEKDMTENDLEYFLQSISIPEEDVAVTPSAVIERDPGSTVQTYTPTSEQVDALINELHQTARKPPKTVPVTTEPPSESDQEDSAHVLLRKKRKRRDPRPGVLITDPVHTVFTPIESSFVAQNIESTFTESSPMMQEISSLLPESTPMDQDFESPMVKQELLPSEGGQASGSSFEAPDSAEKNFIIRKQDIRISDLENEKSIKDAKILKLQENLGGLTALFFDVTHRLHQKFGDDFQPLSIEGEKIYASNSGLINPSSQPASERVLRPAPDANLDTFLSSGPSSAQERKDVGNKTFGSKCSR